MVRISVSISVNELLFYLLINCKCTVCHMSPWCCGAYESTDGLPDLDPKYMPSCYIDCKCISRSLTIMPLLITDLHCIPADHCFATLTMGVTACRVALYAFVLSSVRSKF